MRRCSDDGRHNGVPLYPLCKKPDALWGCAPPPPRCEDCKNSLIPDGHLNMEAAYNYIVLWNAGTTAYKYPDEIKCITKEAFNTLIAGTHFRGYKPVTTVNTSILKVAGWQRWTSPYPLLVGRHSAELWYKAKWHSSSCSCINPTAG